jgi:hypothetical protein
VVRALATFAAMASSRVKLALMPEAEIEKLVMAAQNHARPDARRIQ